MLGKGSEITNSYGCFSGQFTSHLHQSRNLSAVSRTNPLMMGTLSCRRRIGHLAQSGGKAAQRFVHRETVYSTLSQDDSFAWYVQSSTKIHFYKKTI